MDFKRAANYYLDYINATRSNGTYRYQKSKVDILIQILDGFDTKEFTKRDFTSLIVKLRQRNPKVTNTTINKYLSILNRIIYDAEEQKVYYEKLPENKKMINIVSKKIRNLVFSYLRDGSKDRVEMLRTHLLLQLILDSGLRINEAINLKIKNFDMEMKTIKVVETKTKTERYVFYTEKTEMILRKYLIIFNIKNYLFIKYKSDDERISVSNVQAQLYRVERKLNLHEPIKPHKWRHTFATEFLKSGGDLETLRLIMGHTTLKTTQLYLHFDKDHLHSEYFKIYKNA